jgi:hypothetical protein
MELYYNFNNIYIFRVLGNIRIKLLNEYDNLNNKTNLYDYITFKNSNMFIKVKNKHNFIIPYDKCYLSLSYNSISKYPEIECIYQEYIPLFISQPETNININLLEKFNIKPKSLLYKELTNINMQEIEHIYENENINDNEYEIDICNNINNKKIIYPSIIFQDNRQIYLSNNNIDIYSDSTNSDSEYDYNNNYFTDISLSDDSLYN